MLVDNPLSTSPSAYPVLECFHIAGFALAIGMTALVDFRLLGFDVLGQSAAQIMRAFQLWTLGGLVTAVFSGLLIFSTDPDMYYLNWSFLVKMALLVTVIIFNYTIHRQSVSGKYPAHAARLIAVVSLLLWTSVIFGGIFIAVAPNGPG
jgi:hypothetical protein